jgi:predicted MFS family arabinose efflux permease
MAERAAELVVSLPAKPAGIPIVCGLAMGPAVGLGLGRFAYALLLPSMRADLGWSYAAAGAMNTANAVGYLIGALIAAPVAGWLGDKRGFLLGLLLATASLLATGLSSDYTVLILLRTLAGAAGALSFVTGGALAAAAGSGGSRSRPTMALGVYFGGAGFGIVVSAVVTPVVAQSGWRAGWFALGALAAAATLAALPALARAPEVAARTAPRLTLSLGATHGLRIALVSYVLFGLGYIAYTTFIVAYLRTRLAFSDREITLFWTCAGLAASCAGLAWSPLLARFKGGRSVAAANGVVMIGTVLPVLVASPTAAYVSALLFGGSFLIVPTAITALVRKTAPARAWTAAIAAMTVGFAIGQCIGPWLSGVVSDTGLGLAGGLLVSGAFLAAAALIALAQPEPSTPAKA